MKRKKLAGTTVRSMTCPYCGARAVLRPAAEIYKNPECTGELYVCSNYPACNSYVSVHPGTKVPKGELANAELRNLRIKAHRKFDELWQSGAMDRSTAYRWMADGFGMQLRDAHIGMFREYHCRQLIERCDKVLEVRRKAAS